MPAVILEQRCGSCGASNPDYMACADCREKASLFNSYLDDLNSAHADEHRLNILERDRQHLATVIFTDPLRTVREIIDAQTSSVHDHPELG